jgi:RapZ C-terminal domain
VTLVIVGAATAQRVEEAVADFEAAGFQRVQELDGVRDGDYALAVSGGGAELLREADRRGIKYVLVHDGEDDRRPGGTFERAHHRIEPAQRKDLAARLRAATRVRERPLITCLAFGYKNGAPADATLVVDARFLDNPYWVPELKELSGHDRAVVDFVLKQPAAQRLLDGVERMVRDMAPLYADKGRMNLVVAFGCTGGQHRSVVLAAELARRLKETDGMDVAFTARDLD